MAVPTETQTASAAAATAMENRETKRSKKRSIKPSEADSSVELTHSKKKKKQSTEPSQIHAETNHTDSNSIATQEEGGVEATKLSVCIVPTAKKFLLLLSFLKKNLTKKVVVVCSSWQAAKFYTDILKHMKFNAVYFHGNIDKQKNGYPASKFSEADNGILFTDIPVESLQVSSVDWTVLYDPLDIPLPQSWSSIEGNILTFLISNELKYLDHLQEANVQIINYKFENKKLSRGEPQLEKLVEKNHHLYTSAVKAYRSYILAYNQHSMKDVFNVDHLDLVDLECLNEGLRKLTYAHLYRRTAVLNVVLRLKIPCLAEFSPAPRHQ